jgi:membrane fusion protein, multidrug efflux system
MDSIAIERGAVAVRPRLFSASRLRRLALAFAALALVSATVWYAQHWWTAGRYIETTDDAYVGGNVTPLAPHISGFVARILVADNERVQAGQLVIELDQRDYRAALDHAEAVLRARLAAVDSLHAQSAQQLSVIGQQEADLAAKKAGAGFAAQEAVRYHLLAQGAAGSRQNEERASSANEEAKAAVAAAEAALSAARGKLSVLDAQTAEAESAVAQARSDVATAQLNLGYTEIRAPIDGYIGNRAAQLGAYVTAGSYLLSVTPAEGLWIDANFKEDDIGGMVPGQPARVTADMLPGHVFHGHVVSLAPGTGAVFSVIPPENATGNFTKIVQRVPVRILLDNGDRELSRLRPGLSTFVAVDTRENLAKL